VIDRRRNGPKRIIRKKRNLSPRLKRKLENLGDLGRFALRLQKEVGRILGYLGRKLLEGSKLLSYCLLLTLLSDAQLLSKTVNVCHCLGHLLFGFFQFSLQTTTLLTQPFLLRLCNGNVVRRITLSYALRTTAKAYIYDIARTTLPLRNTCVVIGRTR